ncbi:hypothetical protein [Lacihabitans sp. LS3-19]|uniref:hypothetical protein n=1 Tax=Lacihabitans sp. LS3-19 TaxID=2487335 RepID=UPI0020CFE600|nr:hypothetical protein [Lacihabitans sp. LS3-19]
MNKFNLLITALVLFNVSLFGQSVSISPSNHSHIKMFKLSTKVKLRLVESN